MEPWYKVATPRKEVREGRSFNPDEFAIALEQVVAGTAPEDYREPDAVLRAHLLHAGAARARGHGAAPALRAGPTTPRRCSRSSPSSVAARRTR